MVLVTGLRVIGVVELVVGRIEDLKCGSYGTRWLDNTSRLVGGICVVIVVVVVVVVVIVGVYVGIGMEFFFTTCDLVISALLKRVLVNIKRRGYVRVYIPPLCSLACLPPCCQSPLRVT